MNDSINMSFDDEVSKNASNFVSKLSIDDSGYMWKGNLEQLRCFVQDDLNLTGKWSSPGGERKVFTCSTEGIKLKWSGPTQKRLIIVNDTKENLLANAINRVYDKYNSELNSTAASEGLLDVSRVSLGKSNENEKPNKGDKDLTDSQVGKSCFRSSAIQHACLEKVHDENQSVTVNSNAVFQENKRVFNVANRTLQRDLELLKLDVSVLETRLPHAIVQNESNIEALRRKQKDMEIIIQQQKQIICNLNEENQLFKSKLNLFEKQLLELTKNNQGNNVDDESSPVCVSNIPSVTFPPLSKQYADTNSNLNESRPISAEISPLNNITPSSDDHRDPSTRDNSALHMPDAPLLHTCNIDLIDVRLEDQPDVHRLEHQLTFEQFSEKQSEQPSFFDQIKEYRSKHKKSSYDQYKERTNSKRKNVNFHRPRRRYNRQLKSPSNNHYAKI